MNHKHSPAIANHPRSPVIVDLRGSIQESHVQAMIRTLARVLVARALVEHGIRPANDNE